MTNPTISVIVPVYKVENYIHQCLDSLICQTYKDIEIILVDDGSPDRCGEICEEYAAKDARIVVIHQENGGLSAARNTGLDIARGEYIMFVDSDDWVEPTYCEKALEKIQEHQVEIVIFGYYGAYKNIKIAKKAHSPRIMDGNEALRHIILHDEPSLYDAAWNKIYHKSRFQDIRFPLGMIAEDAAVMYKLLHNTPQVFVYDQCLYNYRKRMYSLAGSIVKPSVKTQSHIFIVFYERLAFIREYLPEPELIKHQTLNLTERVMKNRCRLNKKNPEEKRTYDLMTTFLKENRAYLLSLPCDKNTRIYLRSEALYHLHLKIGNVKGKILALFRPHNSRKRPPSPSNLEFFP